MKKSKLSLSILSILLGVFVLTGCPPKKPLKVEQTIPEVKPEDLAANDADKIKEPDIQINQEWSEINSLGLVTFGYDSSQLDDAARSTLKTNVAIIKKLPASVSLRVEGHCDDRGTVEYNIALGQKRASAVSAFYGTSGISKSRLKTISFGEERPLCKEETEDCWAKNRRGSTKVRNEQPITVSPDSLK